MVVPIPTLPIKWLVEVELTCLIEFEKVDASLNNEVPLILIL